MSPDVDQEPKITKNGEAEKSSFDLPGDNPGQKWWKVPPWDPLRIPKPRPFFSPQTPKPSTDPEPVAEGGFTVRSEPSWRSASGTEGETLVPFGSQGWGLRAEVRPATIHLDRFPWRTPPDTLGTASVELCFSAKIGERFELTGFGGTRKLDLRFSRSQPTRNLRAYFGFEFEGAPPFRALTIPLKRWGTMRVGALGVEARIDGSWDHYRMRLELPFFNFFGTVKILGRWGGRNTPPQGIPLSAEGRGFRLQFEPDLPELKKVFQRLFKPSRRR